jgi:SAM-dependent methyltransferase
MEAAEMNKRPSRQMSDRVLRAYQKLGAHYASGVDAKPIYRYYERPAMLSLVGSVEGKRFLEPGPASGFYTETFTNRGADVIAFDIVPDLVAHVKRRVGDRATVLVADLHDPFGVRLLEDRWTADRVEVHFYRRPLQAMIAPLLQGGFVLTDLVEPRPTNPEEYREQAPEEYRRLQTQPWFLCIKAMKPS